MTPIQSTAVSIFFISIWIGLECTSAAYAEERPDEAAMFGASEESIPSFSSSPTTPSTPQGKKPNKTPSETERSKTPRPGETDAFASGEAKENPLQIGGTFYHRLIFSPQENTSLGNTPLSAPLQVDGFLDAQPNDDLRAYVGPRLLFDPTRDSYSKTTGGSSLSSNNLTSSTSSGPTSIGSTSSSVPNNPQVVLDQAWLTFNFDHKVFVTLGKQHVKWGASRFWNPTDFLHTQKRDPLLTKDVRLGNTMVKFQIPTRRTGTNFYAIALLDNPVAASTADQLGSAFRAETVLGNTEFGLEAIYRGGATPVYGADLSSPLGPIDIYAEAAYRTTPANPMYSLNSNLTAGSNLSSIVSSVQPSGPFFQISGGLNYAFAWKDSRQATLGFEYFYNQLGYNNNTIYPILIFEGVFQPFYLGKNYASIYLTAEGPDEGKRTNYTLSTLANLSDHSLITRLDFSWRVLVYLTFEAYGDVHYGAEGGEFRFSLNTPILTSQSSVIPPIYNPSTLFDLGIGFRMSL
jgi:hypothetical protein